MSISPNFNDMGWIENIKSISKTDTAKNSAILLMANVVSQLLGIVFYPILTRIYSPDDFGLLNLFGSIAGILTLCSTAEYQYSIMLPKSRKSAVACFHVGFLILLFTTSLCFVSVLFGKPIASVFNAPDLAKYYWLMPFYVFGIGLWTLLNYWFTRNKRFKDISIYLVSQSGWNGLIKYFMGIGGALHIGLILGTVLAPFISILMIIKKSIHTVLKPLFVWDRGECQSVAATYANFPKYSLPRALVNNVSLNLPVLLLTPFFGTSIIGLFGMAVTLSFRPISMIAGSLYQSFYQKFTENVHQNMPIYPLYRKYIRMTLLVVIPFFVLLYPVLPFLSGWFLGEEWIVAGEYIRILLPWLAGTLLLGPFSFLLDIFQKQKLGMFYEVIYLILRFIGLMIGVWMKDFKLAILLYSLISLFMLIVLWVYYHVLLIRYEKRLNRFL